jgi:hypothetical protein
MTDRRRHVAVERGHATEHIVDRQSGAVPACDVE